MRTLKVKTTVIISADLSDKEKIENTITDMFADTFEVVDEVEIEIKEIDGEDESASEEEEDY